MSFLTIRSKSIAAVVFALVLAATSALTSSTASAANPFCKSGVAWVLRDHGPAAVNGKKMVQTRYVSVTNCQNLKTSLQITDLQYSPRTSNIPYGIYSLQKMHGWSGVSGAAGGFIIDFPSFGWQMLDLKSPVAQTKVWGSVIWVKY